MATKPLSIYLPDDADAIAALQDRLKAIKIPEPYSKAEEDKIMSGRKSQADIDAGRNTIAQRRQAIKDAQAQYNALVQELRQTKQEAAGRYTIAKAQEARDTRAAEDATPYGQTMNALESIGPRVAGMGVGAAEALGMGRGLNRVSTQRANNLISIAGDLDKIDPRSPAALAQMEGRVAAARPYMPPKNPALNSLSRVGGIGGRAVALGVLPTLEGVEYMAYDRQANDPAASDAQRAFDRGIANALLTSAATGGVIGAHQAFLPNIPNTGNAQAKIRTAEAMLRSGGQNGAARGPINPGTEFERAAVSAEPSPEPVRPAAAEVPNRYRGRYGSVARELAGDMGLHVPSKAGKADSLKRALAHVENMNADALRTVAAKIPEIGANATPSQMRSGVKDLITRLGKGSGSLPAILAALGVGAAAMGPDRAEASPYAPGESRLTVPTSRGERAVNALRRVGDAMREVPGQLAEGARNLPQSIREGTFGFQSGEFGVTPEQMDAAEAAQNLRLAQAEDARQVAGMRPRNALFAPEITQSIQEDAARRPEMSQPMVNRGLPPEAMASYRMMQGGEPLVRNELAMSGPDAAFLAALRDFSDHFAKSQGNAR